MLRRKTWGLLFAILLGQLLISILAGASVTYGAGYAKAPDGLVIWGKDISGMVQEEAYEVLIEEIPKAVIHDQTIYPLVLTQTYQNLHDYLTSQFTISTGNFITDSLEYLRRMSFSSPSPQKLYDEEIVSQLKTIAQSIDQEGKASRVYYGDGSVVLDRGSAGVLVNVERSWEQLLQSDGLEAVPLITEVIEIHPTTAELAKVKSPLGDYTTYFDPYFYERVNNVQLAAEAINGLLLPPGEEFSFNDVVGKRDPERGYLPAYVFLGNQVGIDDGGGICQDSTTLYQAVKQANLQILERHTHSLPVSYVPLQEDATVAYGVLDFRFRNSTQSYLLISATTGKNWIRVRVFGQSDSRHPLLQEPDGYPVKPEDWLSDPK
ncbi:putative vancomycin resistance protein [Desulfitobacterium dichloroeliminans LMG P-21439]|uniref:Putative vancomycin resistance protein n=1 Tax=Desulfitobacterium dichloroeliminans (strain LMG P-21439 / DCA1) TaxID=871963 RepID=L0FAA8_DESDL|nr:VanW family protein [Desulfitobacterium dichloroeliminans]AGA69576.1 putative vancomycin resistance protein [Desulfitobacterium dichloroeliminans LMG P-21439]